MSKHTPEDSLRWLDANGLIDAAIETIEDGAENNDVHALDTAVSMLEAVRNEIRYEAELHGVHARRYYSTGNPVLVQRDRTYPEPGADGITRIVTCPVIVAPYPDGGDAHPLFRDDEEPVA